LPITDVGNALVVSNDRYEVRVRVLKVRGSNAPRKQTGQRYRWIGILLRLTNVGKKTFVDRRGDDPVIIDSQKRGFEAVASKRFGPRFTAHKVRRGSSRTGYVTFRIPSGSKPRLFQFVLDGGFDPAAAQWRLKDH
jgi:hypothetical protein